MPVLRVIPWTLWIALVLFSAATYAGLPEMIPRHFNASGIVTGAAARTWFNWMLLPLVAGAVQALLHLLGASMPSHPELFNFPEKERFLKIPKTFQAPVVDRMRDVMDVTGGAMMLIMCAVQLCLWQAAMGRPTAALFPMLIVATIALVPIILLMTTRVNSAVDEAERRWKTSEAAAARRN